MNYENEISRQLEAMNHNSHELFYADRSEGIHGTLEEVAEFIWADAIDEGLAEPQNIKLPSGLTIAWNHKLFEACFCTGSISETQLVEMLVQKEVHHV